MSIIRPATKQDLSDIQQLDQALNAERENMWDETTQQFHVRTSPRDSIALSKNDICFVAEEGDAIIGCVVGSITERKHYTLSKLGSLDVLYIMPEYRKQGIASELLKKLEQEFRTRGCDHITTHTDAENLRAQGLYENMDMHKVTIEY